MKIIEKKDLFARSGGAWTITIGQCIKVVDVEGGQIGDFVCFDANNLKRRFSQARTKANQGKFLISTGDHLYSRDNKILLTITKDTYGIHDLQYGMCSAWVFEQLKSRIYKGFSEQMAVGGPLGVPSFGCYEVLQEALKDWPIEPEDIPDPLNLFQTMDYDIENGKFAIAEGKSKPGDYIVLEAQMDVLCALSACPSTGKPLYVEVYEE